MNPQKSNRERLGPPLRPWWDFRAAWVVFWRVRSTVYRGNRHAPWWAGWRATFVAWWRVGHGQWFHS